MVLTQDINQIRVGQITQLRLSACPYSDYGALRGTVKTIAPDVTTSPSTQPFYEVTVASEKQAINQHSQVCQVKAGMEGQIDIITQSDTVLRALLRKARFIDHI